LYTKKQREPCVLFLEAGFGTKVHPEALRKAGWLVECFGGHFRDPDGRISDGIKDPQIIRFCNTQKWVLVTTDRQMRNTHVETIKATEVAIIATVNNKYSPEVWVKALNKAKAKIERHVKKHPRPWFAILGSSGSISFETVSSTAYTRRDRPKEGQEKKE
jgi:uncharacterized protein DUF5615